MRAVTVLAFVALALAGCAADPAKDAADGGDGPQAGALEGVVVDDAIRPVAGARVVLDNARNATTGSDGLFRFDAVEPGAHIVRATANGYADAVTQVIVASSEPTPLVKLVLLLDTSNLAYAETISIEGFVECGTYTVGRYFAACGTGNVGSFILCAQAGQCMGNLTGDRYITIAWFSKQPDFLVAEVAWVSTQALGTQLSIWLGSATKEQLQFYPETPSVHNTSSGPSPIYVTMDKAMLLESGIGLDSWFLAQTFAEQAEGVPVELGATMQQRFQMILTSFYGYEPPADWRFTATGVAPPPPTAK